MKSYVKIVLVASFFVLASKSLCVKTGESVTVTAGAGSGAGAEETPSKLDSKFATMFAAKFNDYDFASQFIGLNSAEEEDTVDFIRELTKSGKPKILVLTYSTASRPKVQEFLKSIAPILESNTVTATYIIKDYDEFDDQAIFKAKVAEEFKELPSTVGHIINFYASFPAEQLDIFTKERRVAKSFLLSLLKDDIENNMITLENRRK